MAPAGSTSLGQTALHSPTKVQCQMPSCEAMTSWRSSRPDGSDNCPLVANFSQTDNDNDGFGNACDLCLLVPQRAMIDADHDGFGDPCDVCPFFGDTDQVDTDSDGSGDLCDPDPGDSAEGVPSGAITLNASHDRGTGETTLSWNAEGLSATYQTIRGSAEEVEARFYGSCQNSRDANTADTIFVEDETPLPGEVFHFVIIGVSPGGTRGLAGLDSDSRQRDFRAKDCL